MKILSAIFIILVLWTTFLVFCSCESPTAVKERSQDTEQIRDENGGRN